VLSWLWNILLYFECPPIYLKSGEMSWAKALVLPWLEEIVNTKLLHWKNNQRSIVTKSEKPLTQKKKEMPTFKLPSKQVEENKLSLMSTRMNYGVFSMEILIILFKWARSKILSKASIWTSMLIPRFHQPRELGLAIDNFSKFTKNITTARHRCPFSKLNSSKWKKE